MRDEELISGKAVHISTTNAFPALNSLSSIGKQYTYYMLGAYVTRSTFQSAVGEKGFPSFGELLNFFKHMPPAAA